MQASGSAVVSAQPGLATPDAVAVDVAFHLTLSPLGEEVLLTCWSNDERLAECAWRDVSLSGATNDRREMRAHGSATGFTRGPDGHTILDVHCFQFLIEPPGVPAADVSAWSVPLFGWDFQGEVPAQDAQEVERRRAANLDGSCLGDWASWTDVQWGSRTLRLRRDSQFPESVNGLRLVGEVGLTSEGGLSEHTVLDDFGVVYDLMSPLSGVYWSPSLMACAPQQRVFWRRQDRPVLAGQGLSRWDLLGWDVNPYLEAMLHLYSESAGDPAGESKCQALRILAKMAAAPELPIEQSVLSTCGGFEVLKSHLWHGEKQYRVSKEAKAGLRRSVRRLASALDDEEAVEFRETVDVRTDQLLRRPLRCVVRSMLRDYLGSEDGAGAVGEAIGMRNAATHEGLLRTREHRSLEAANRSVEARKVLWRCLLALANLELDEGAMGAAAIRVRRPRREHE
jgi:hypothetical protein